MAKALGREAEAQAIWGLVRVAVRWGGVYTELHGAGPQLSALGQAEQSDCS